tara:strand:- start:1862 stop:2674 length:813 start_codon:yes stop_codon:yes gene_type:complete
LNIKSKILIIAGSDSSGGAGIQADIKTVTALGSYAMTAVTAVTSQNTTGINSIIAIPPKDILNQILFTSKDIKPDAIKIGMLHSQDVVKKVIKSLNKIKVNKIVLDPVMVAKGGTRLINKNSINIIKTKLINKVLLITPNIPEAEELSGIRITNVKEMIKSALIIKKTCYAKNILVKGGHLNTKDIYDVLLSNNKINIFKSKKINSKNTHGTGCTLSSAITVYISCGKTLKRSCELGIKYVNHAIKSGPKFGKGHGPINHINNIVIKNLK